MIGDKREPEQPSHKPLDQKSNPFAALRKALQ